jgi:hypothetical protein
LAKGQVWTGPVLFRSCPDTGGWLFGDDGDAEVGSVELHILAIGTLPDIGEVVKTRRSFVTPTGERWASSRMNGLRAGATVRRQINDKQMKLKEAPDAG